MKKLFVIALVLLLASPCFGAVDVQRTNGKGVSHLGLVETIDVGNAGQVAGNTLYLGYTYIDGGTSTMVSGPAAVPVTYKTVHMDLTGGNAVLSTLANGTNGQVLNLDVTVNPSSAYVWTITPATTTGFTTITLGHVGTSVTLLFVNSTVGWVVVDQRGATIA
jgi:hypothetical protein